MNPIGSVQSSLRRTWWFVAALLLLGVGAVRAQEKADCLVCHEDKELTAVRKGVTVSLTVNEKRFDASVHGNLTCVNCHTDLEGKEMPHEAPLTRVPSDRSRSP